MSQENQSTLSKEEVKFEANWRKIQAILQGDAFFKTSKFTEEDVHIALAMLTEDEKKTRIEGFITEVKSLINEKRAFDKFVAQQRREMQQKINEKRKEMNNKFSTLIARIEDMESIEQDYYNTIRSLSQEGNDPVDENPTEETL